MKTPWTALLGAVALAVSLGMPGKASAQLMPVVTENGAITLSVDGHGTRLQTGTVDVQKDSDLATVRIAHLACATTDGVPEIPDGDVQLNGMGVVWDQVVPSAGAITINNQLSDVTAIVAPTLDAAPAGITSLFLDEGVNTFAIDGCLLAVIFDDPNVLVNRTAILLFGTQTTTGDRFLIGLADPIDIFDPDLVLDFGLGISFSVQDAGALAVSNLCGRSSGQNSEVEVNGLRMTSCAGNSDDGLLFTVGGVGDSNANPVEPFGAAPLPSTSPDLVEDELYTLIPFVVDGDTLITVDTINPSNNDNILFAHLFTSGQASIGNTRPVADAGPDQVVECRDPAGTLVTLDGSGSLDADGDPLTFAWSNSFGTATGMSPTVSLPLGTHLITLVVNDGQINSEPDTITVDVVNTTAPGLVASLTPVSAGDDDGDDDGGRFRINFSASDACDPAFSVMAVLVVPGVADIPVVDGQIIKFKFKDNKMDVKAKHGKLKIKASSLTLRVTATDASGYTATAEVQLAGLGEDEDEDEDEYEDEDIVAFADDDEDD